MRSVKSAMASLHEYRAPSEEVFQTLLDEAESMVNSRPLTYMPLDTADHEALTPNHFILLSSSGVKQTEKDPTTDGAALRSGWNQCQHLLDEFWRRWIHEYLPTITRRTKWFVDVKPIQVGDVVFIVDEGSIRNSWIRGRVIKVYPGKDGRVRHADVQISSSLVLRRSTVNLAVMDIMRQGNAAEPQQHYGSGNVDDCATGVLGHVQIAHRGSETAGHSLRDSRDRFRYVSSTLCEATSNDTKQEFKTNK